MKLIRILVIPVMASIFCVYAYGGSVFFGADDWDNIDGMGRSPGEKMKFKTFILQAGYEATIFAGSPIIDPTGRGKINLTQYVNMADKFYRSKGNRDIPVVFVLKMVDLMRSGADIKTVQSVMAPMIEEFRVKSGS